MLAFVLAFFARCGAPSGSVEPRRRTLVDLSPCTFGYTDSSSTAIARHKSAGAVVLVAHTEDWTPEQLTTLPLDGFEMYNLHANTLQVGQKERLAELFAMISERSARLMNLKDYGIKIGSQAEVTVIDAKSPAEAVATVAPRGGYRTTTSCAWAGRHAYPSGPSSAGCTAKRPRTTTSHCSTFLR